ncbi:MAG: response regulator [Desulfobulbaceae bacterium]|nr:response regulator [Desulfobulbaceae bacterium]
MLLYQTTHFIVHDKGTYLGIVSISNILCSVQQRIFADLLQHSSYPVLKDYTPARKVFDVMEEADVDAVAVSTEGGKVFGVVTQASLLKGLLSENELSLVESNRLNSHHESFRILGQMAGGIIHDLNNSLQLIISHLEMFLYDEDFSGKQTQKIQSAMTVVCDITDRIRKLRAFYKHDEKIAYDSAVELNNLVEEVRLLSQPKWKTEAGQGNKEIEFYTELSSLPAILGNSSELRQVLMNIIFNAVDAIDGKGEIHIKTSKFDNCALLEIMDSGRGMTPEQHLRCFEPLYTTKEEAGTGLGLSISREIVTSHGGHLDLDTTLNAGTTVRLYFPFMAAGNSDSSFTNPRADKGKILFFEDDRRSIPVISNIFKLLNRSIDIAPKVSVGMEMFAVKKYDLVITDLCMPETDGVEILRMIKKSRPEVPVIMTTGPYTLANLPGILQREQPDLFLEKPLTFFHLKNSLQQF